MAGIMLKGEDTENYKAIEQFVNKSKTLFGRINLLSKWKALIMRENFRTLGLTEDVLLSKYLSNRDHLPGKDEAVKGLTKLFYAEEEKEYYKKYAVEVKIIRN